MSTKAVSEVLLAVVFLAGCGSSPSRPMSCDQADDCPDDQVCIADHCYPMPCDGDAGSHCYIGEQCQIAGSANPSNPCERCDPEENLAAWSAAPTTTECRPVAGECDTAEFCDDDGTCPADDFLPIATECRSVAGECDVAENCTGSEPDCPPDAFVPSGTVCGSIEGECFIQDTCDGSGVCVDNGFQPPGTFCGDNTDTECNNPDTCDATGTCLPNHEPGGDTVTCGDAAADCVNQDYCAGDGTCTDYGYWDEGTSCGDISDTECTDPDTCDATGTCLPNHEPGGDTVTCGDAAADCVNQDYCAGDGTCTDYGYWDEGTSCGNPSQTECTDPDTCDGAGVCAPNHVADTTPCDDGYVCTPASSCSFGVCIGTPVSEMVDDFDRPDQAGLGNNLLGNPWTNYGGPSHQWSIVGGNAEVLSQGIPEPKPDASSDAGHRSAFDIQARFQFSEVVGGTGGGAFVLYANVTGAGVTSDGLMARIAVNDYSTHILTRDGIDLDTGTQPLAADVWYLMRFRFDGSTLQLRLWEDGTPEPTTWLLSAAASDVPTSRAHVGIYGDSDIGEAARIRVDQILDECGPWNTLPMTGAPEARLGHSSAWTGTELIIWGGERVHDGAVTNTGYRYDPVLRQWTAISLVDAPSARYTPGAPSAGVWVASRFCIWGGARYTGDYENYGDGACYDPAMDTWAPIATSGAPSSRRSHSILSTGDRMIVWGGICTGTGCTTTGTLDDGAIYDPGTDTWAPVMTNGSPPSARYSHTAVWTGTEMIVWGGENGHLETGARYDLAGETWTAVPSGPCGRSAHAAVWTGSEMIVWGGFGSSCPNGGFPPTVERYDPVGDAWNSCCATDAPEARQSPTAVWTGDVMVVWGGNTSPMPLNTGGAFDPTTDTWTPVTTLGAPAPRTAHSAVWTGNEMIVWGGHDTTVPGVYGDGGSFRP